MKQPERSREKGYIVLVTVLILGVVATTVTLFLLLTSTNTGVTSSGVEAKAKARAAALGCAQLALAQLKSEPSLVTPVNESFTVNSGQQQDCTYLIEGTSPDYTILATGVVRPTTDNVVHRLSITTNQTSPQVIVSGWEDVP